MTEGMPARTTSDNSFVKTIPLSLEKAPYKFSRAGLVSTHETTTLHNNPRPAILHSYRIPSNTDRGHPRHRLLGDFLELSNDHHAANNHGNAQ